MRWVRSTTTSPTAGNGSNRSSRRCRSLGPSATAREIVEVVYADVDPVLWGAAELSVRAQLAYLAERG